MKIPNSWVKLSFQDKCKFIAKLIGNGWSKNNLSGFMKRRYKVREREWMKCVNALDDNCDYMGRELTNESR